MAMTSSSSWRDGWSVRYLRSVTSAPREPAVSTAWRLVEQFWLCQMVVGIETKVPGRGEGPGAAPGPSLHSLRRLLVHDDRRAHRHVVLGPDHVHGRVRDPHAAVGGRKAG